MIFDLSKSGLLTVFKPYQIEAFRYLETQPGYRSSREVYDAVNEEILISRASIINFLNAMVEEGLLGHREAFGKGGVRGLYKMRYSAEELCVEIAARIVRHVNNELVPGTTQEAG